MPNMLTFLFFLNCAPDNYNFRCISTVNQTTKVLTAQKYNLIIRIFTISDFLFIIIKMSQIPPGNVAQILESKGRFSDVSLLVLGDFSIRQE